jgi:hypothetical protein
MEPAWEKVGAGKFPLSSLTKTIAIRTMEPAWRKIAQGNFTLGSYKDANNQSRPCYSLTKTECLYIATSCTPASSRWECQS